MRVALRSLEAGHSCPAFLGARIDVDNSVHAPEWGGE